MNRLAFLHTSPVHVETFAQLVRELRPEAEAMHFVREDLLAAARAEGAGAADVVQRVHAAMRDAASAADAAVVVCTCSTIGGAAEGTPAASFAAMRIDRAMADRAVRLGPRVLVAAALESTLAPTAGLLRESAERAGVSIEPRPMLVSGAWGLFERGDVSGYLDAVAHAVREAARDVDIVVLAQASMAGAASLLDDLTVEVLASPRMGVQAALDLLRGA